MMDYFNESELEGYKKEFSESKFWNKITKYAKKAGLKVVYTALLLFYAFKRPETPFWAKSIITGVLSYLISPIDFIPDLTPVLGYTDDMAMLGFGLATVAVYINAQVKENAKQKITSWFGEMDESQLENLNK